METLLDGTYVINMDSDRIRLEEFDSMMRPSNWKYERFSAINGKKLLGPQSNITDPDEREKYRLLGALKTSYMGNTAFLTPGEVGCLLSHVSLWDEVANNPEKNRIAIFEDDARSHVDGSTVQKHIIDFYAYLEENNIPEPDILYLGKALDNCLAYKKVWNNVYRSKHPLCLHAYIINKLGAQKLLDKAPFQDPIDVIPIKAAQEAEIDAMVFHPSMYFQDIFGATSNLRKLKEGLNSTTECLVFQQHLSADTLEYAGVVITGLIAAMILFIIFSWYRPWNLI